MNKASEVLNLLESIISGIHWESKGRADTTSINEIDIIYNKLNMSVTFRIGEQRIRVKVSNERTGKDLVSNLSPLLLKIKGFDELYNMINNVADEIGCVLLDS